MTKPLTCHTAADGTRVLPTHRRDCVTAYCTGCEPCPEPHCSTCSHRHLDDQHPRRCAACVGRTRTLIRDVVEQVHEAHHQYLLTTPTAAAFLVVTPPANYEAASYVHQSATSGRLCKCRTLRGLTACLGDQAPIAGPACLRCSHFTCRAVRTPPVCPDTSWILEETRDDSLHPLTLLQAWSLAWRRVLDHDPDDGPTRPETEWTVAAPGGPTIATSAHYLLTQLTYMAQHPDSGIDDLDRELTACLAWLEQVLNTSTRPERGELCPACRNHRLERHHGNVDDGEDVHATPCPDCSVPASEHPHARCRLTGLQVIAEVHDRWVCPGAECAQTWTESEYRTRVQGTYVDHAHALPASTLATKLRVSEATVRSWALRGHVKKHGRDHHGRQLYDVAQAEAMRSGSLQA